MDKNSLEKESDCSWSAHKMHWSILGYVLLVYLVFILAGGLIFHAYEAVKVLGIAAFGNMLGLLPGVLNHNEYKLTKQTLEYRSMREGDGPYEILFRLDQVSHIKASRYGCKFFLLNRDKNPVFRLLQEMFQKGNSGMFRIKKRDRERVLNALNSYGVPLK